MYTVYVLRDSMSEQLEGKESAVAAGKRQLDYEHFRVKRLI